ncbi:MAG: MFS transporter [Propionibacteriales bacterium]|nr:MFS transporter [Propionibacteriales bacterium]
MAFGAAPTPLWPLYEARDGVGATTVTVAFTMLVVGAAISFLTLGHLSDRLGRRRVVVPALLTGILAATVLMAWPHLPGLLLGRLLNGLAIGLMASTAVAYLHDLHREAWPHRPGSALPGIVATAANLGGLALGPLVAGAVAAWAPSPLTTAQALFAAAMTVALLLVLSAPETVDLTRREEGHARRFALLPESRVAFGAAAALGFVAFAVFGLFSSLGSTMLYDTLGIGSPIVAGLAPSLMFAAAAVGQLTLGRLSLPRIMVAGVLAFLAGLALAALAIHQPALWLYLAAVGTAGAGSGLLFKAGLVQTGAIADPASRAGVLAVFYVVGYFGMGIPSVLFSLAIDGFGLGAAMTGFAAVLAIGAGVSAAVAIGALRTAPGSRG